ncbi:MAG: TlpA family protein disulfide reductase, partial [Bacteroidetes bacterium]|nr:TlpA family protein disulfide reductase [Bacteroidota bacterium]
IKSLTISPDAHGNFSVLYTYDQPDYYQFQVGQRTIFLIIKDTTSLKIYADGKQLEKFCNIVGSDESKAMFDFLLVADKWKLKIDSANRAIQADKSKEKEINEYMQKQYFSFQNELQTFTGANQNSPALIAALSVMNMQNDLEGYDRILSQLQQAFGQSSLVKQYVADFTNYKKKLDEGKPLAQGKVAPDFEEILAKPLKGKKTMKLSDLKGKVVLIDFWASWCGPCRRENPNVVKTYEKYEKDGFTILSVSLDNDKAKWLEAIEKDKLIWPYHVSDLGGWNSKVARMYEVSSVPFTVLLGKDGKIIKTNLRGPALEAELVKIFGH